MKKMKKVMALLLSLVMVLAMSVVVFATEPSSPATSGTYTITINNSKTGHTYEAYQIFTGTLSDDTLSDIQWGDGVNTTGQTQLGNASKKAATLTTEAQAAAFAKSVAPYLQGAVESSFADGKYTISGLQAGYYLVKDKNNTLTSADDCYTAYIMQVVRNVTAIPKGEKPSVEKKVQENVKTDNTTDGYGDRYNDTADYNIGDAVPFKLIGTVPDMSKYAKYKYTFHDTLSNAFDRPITISVYVASDKAGTDKMPVTDGFTPNIVVNTDKTVSITVSTDDLKTIKYTKGAETATEVQEGQYIIVEYKAVLNSNARVGQKEPGNTNEVYLTYSNNPNQSGDGKPEEGHTPVDKVIVFTYELDVNKVDGADNKKLEGVTFNLYKKENDVKKYAKVVNGKLAGWTETEAEATELKTDTDGLIKVAGLDDGTYYIHEIKPLAGYNSIADVEIVITADTSNGQSGNGAVSELVSIDVTANGVAGTGNAAAGTATVTIANNKGSNLPSTGGMGTTIFYVVGSILVLGAAILLITKKRMSAR